MPRYRFIETAAAAARSAARHPAINRERQARWDRRHIRSVCTKLSVEEMAELRAICRRLRTTPYAITRYMLLLFIKEYWREHPERSGT